MCRSNGRILTRWYRCSVGTLDVDRTGSQVALSMADPMMSSATASWLPKNTRMTVATTALSDSISPYSTSPWPRSVDRTPTPAGSARLATGRAVHDEQHLGPLGEELGRDRERGGPALDLPPV
jgi:hypothetical protein